MKEEPNKYVNIILIIIFTIIILILILYIFNQFLNIKNKEEFVLPTTKVTTTQALDYGFKKLTDNEKIAFNNYLNDNIILKAFNNAINKNEHVYNINLIQTEISKFKFIYTYLKLQNMEQDITFDLINEYSNKLFKTSLYQENLTSFWQGDKYYFEFDNQELDYCLKAKSQKDNTIFIDIIKKIDNKCNNEVLDYNETNIINQIKLDYLIEDEIMIYNSYVIVK